MLAASGYMIGFTGFLGMSKRAGPTIAALKRLFDANDGSGGAGVATLTLDRIMLETDAPFMAPDKAWLPTATGLGGRKNEPATMPAVCRAFAQAIGADEVTVAQASTANARRFFGLAERSAVVYRS